MIFIITFVRKKKIVRNGNYKPTTNLHKRMQDFAEGDQIIVRVCPYRFLSRTLKKLYT